MDQVDALMESMKIQIERTVRLKMDGFAKQILERALFYRSQLVGMDIGHNYTGNFVNAIGVGIYYYGAFQRGYYASQELGKPPVMGKMTTKKSGQGREYKFSVDQGHPDYQGEDSSYIAEIQTDKKKINQRMVEDVLRSIKTRNKDGYSIILAYAVEYAEYIENIRSSTGLALVQDEFSSKVKEIQDYFTKDAGLAAKNSNLAMAKWDELVAKQAVGGDSDRAADYLTMMGEQGKSVHPGDPNENPYIWFTSIDDSPIDITPNNPADDPLGSNFDPSEPAPF